MCQWRTSIQRFWLVSTLTVFIGLCGGLRFEVNHGVLDTTYNKTINNIVQHVYEFRLPYAKSSELSIYNFHVETSVNQNSSRTCPLMFIIKQSTSSLFWHIPQFIGSDELPNKYVYKANRTMCLEPHQDDSDKVTVEVSTCSRKRITYRLYATFLSNAILSLQKAHIVKTSVSSPTFYKYYFNDLSPETLIIRMQSETPDCTLISIQSPKTPNSEFWIITISLPCYSYIVLSHQTFIRMLDNTRNATAISKFKITCRVDSPNERNHRRVLTNFSRKQKQMEFIPQKHCPVVNKEANVRFDGFWQTVTYQTGVTIQRREFPDGFFISFTVLSDDSFCSQDFGVSRTESKNVSRRTVKELSLVVGAELRESDYTWAIIVPLLCYGALMLVTFIIFLIFHRLRVQLDDEYRRTYSAPEVQEGSSENEEELIKKFHTRNPLCICHIRKMGDADLLKKSKRYYLSMITIVIFYLVPVFQLIIHYMEVMKSTGEQDLCYYNYLCSHPLHKFKDFNHMYSNIGYVILGAHFLVLVCIRELSCVSDENKLPPLEPLDKKQRWQKFWPLFPKTLKRNDHGTIQHVGHYVAMALAHILEGLMSATYHICPNQSNFQFDMAFMYVIAVLNITKVYTYRHPVYISATLLFACLGMIACSAVFGLMFQSDTYLFCFSIFYGCFVFLILFYLYHVGYIRVNGEIETTFFGVYKALLLFSFGWLRKRFKKIIQIEDHEQCEICFLSGQLKIILPVTGAIFNAGLMLLVWTVLQKHNFATQVLTIFVVNSTGYTAYYSIMKIFHRECKNILALQPAIYALLSFVYWMISLRYFMIVLTSWETSAAESRVQNTDCVAMGFYDFHDIWHFYSSSAMFFSFMILLTLDDDMHNVPQNKIPVF